MGDKVCNPSYEGSEVPCVPGSDGPLPEDPDEDIRITREIGYPIIIRLLLAAAGVEYAGVREAAFKNYLDDSHGSACRVRRRYCLHGKVSRQATAHRDSSAR